MKTIKINRLSLENFKCHQSLTLDFGGRDASIYGDNATGKTSIYDALTWLLFGKDSAGNGEKNIEIKPLDANGEVKDHLAVTAVEAALQVDGQQVILRRTYQEIWTTKRGSAEATYDGNTSEYYVDGVPCKKFAFQEKVQELVDEYTFRMLTSVSYFASGISWQERRERLFHVAGVQQDEQILATDARFAPLVESMGRLGLEDYKKKLLAEKRKFVGAKTEIPARINECQKTIDDIASLDFAAARAEADVLTAQKEEISTKILSLDHDNGAEQKSLQIREAQLELLALENENKAFRASQAAPTMNVNSLNAALNDLNIKRNQAQWDLERESNAITEHDKMTAEARSAWLSVNSEVFAGGTCQTCGQNLPADKLQKAMDAFESHKQSRLRDIQERANFYKDAKQKAEERIARLQENIRLLDSEIQTKQQQIADAKEQVVKIVDMDGFAERKAAIQARIDSLNTELFEIQSNTASVKASLRQEASRITEQLSAKMDIIGKESILEYSRKRIEELRQDAKNTAQCLESIEKMLFLMDEYSRYKTQFVEQSINGLFRIARFRLFREQANGGVEDRCDVVYDGVPYISVNNGMKINLGIDIINTLSRAYGVTVPLFVDNAESVTNLEKCDSQVIRLVVSESDKELRVV